MDIKNEEQTKKLMTHLRTLEKEVSDHAKAIAQHKKLRKEKINLIFKLLRVD